MRKRNAVDQATGTKQCADCGEVKPVSAFHVRKTGYVYSYCQPCNTRRAGAWKANNRDQANQTLAKWVAENPERHKESRKDAHYRRRYGITFTEVRERLERQAFMCAICRCELSEDSLVIDHCHANGNVRGILCNLCNISLAPIERPGFLDAALAYIESHRNGS